MRARWFFMIVVGAGMTTGIACSSSDKSNDPPPAGADAGPDAGQGSSSFDAVYTIFAQSCADDCHHASTPSSPASGNLALTPKADAYNNLVHVPASGQACGGADAGAGTSFMRVVPGDAAHSLLVQKLTDAHPPCGVQMPKDDAPLSAQDLQTIKDWINNGAPGP